MPPRQGCAPAPRLHGQCWKFRGHHYPSQTDQPCPCCSWIAPTPTANPGCRPALKSRTIGPKAILWHSNPGQRRRFALKPRTKLTATWAGHSEATAARSASPKTPAISARNTGLPSCVVARYGVYGQRLRYRWYSLDRKRRRSAVGHRRLVFSSMAPWNSGITLNSLAHRRRPRVPRRRRTDSCELRRRAPVLSEVGSPPPAPRRAPTGCRRLPPMGATFAFKFRTNFSVQSVWGFSTTVRD